MPSDVGCALNFVQFRSERELTFGVISRHFAPRRTTLYSITSSASSWIELGISIPSVLAVLTLMTKSNSGRLLNRDVARICPAQNFVNDLCDASKHGAEVWSVRYESTGLPEIVGCEGNWDLHIMGTSDDKQSIRASQGVFNDVGRIRSALETIDHGRDLISSLNPVWLDFNTEALGVFLNSFHLVHFRGITGIKQCR